MTGVKKNCVKTFMDKYLVLVIKSRFPRPAHSVSLVVIDPFQAFNLSLKEHQGRRMRNLDIAEAKEVACNDDLGLAMVVVVQTLHVFQLNKITGEILGVETR